MNFGNIFLIFVLLNLFLYFFHKKTQSLKTLHKVFSVCDTISMYALVGLGTFFNVQTDTLTKSVLTFCVILIFTIGHFFIVTIRSECSDEELSSFVIQRGIINLFLSQETKNKLALTFMKIWTFPFYYIRLAFT